MHACNGIIPLVLYLQKNDLHTELLYGVWALEKDCVIPSFLRYPISVFEI